jgi:hypothetical protein
MKLQIIQDGKGRATGVFIPMTDWKALKKKHKDLEELEHQELSKNEVLNEIKQAVYELKLIEQGKLKSRPAKALLDEL